MRRLLPLFVLLAGCAVPPPAPRAALLYQVAPDSVLVLARDVEIPANAARVYFQGGGVRDVQSVDPWHPHCWFLSRVVAADPQAVRADRFRIVRAYRGVEQARAPAAVFLRAGGPDGGPPAFMFATVFELSSARQPHVMHLECTIKADYARGDHLDVEQFRQAVGTHLQLLAPGNV